MSVKYSAGLATAYGAAVRGGYQGTYEEYCEAMAQFPADAEEVNAAVEEFVEETVPGAVQAVGIAGSTQVERVQQEGSTQVGAVRHEGSDQIAAVEEKGKDVRQSIPSDYTELAGDVADLKRAVDEVEKSLETDYAKVDGYYDEMAVGSAEQLISTVLTEDQVPYNFRTSGGSADIGNRETDVVVGGTVVWNQLIRNGNFIDATSWGAANGKLSVANNIATVEYQAGTKPRLYQNIAATKSNHAYLICCEISDTSSDTIRIGLAGGNIGGTSSSLVSVGASKQTVGTVLKTSLTMLFLVVGYPNVYSIVTADAGSFSVGNVRLYDLTQMFGPTIADYIYGLETAEAGAGVAWFRKLFPNDYYEYNPGELMSVKASAHEMVGFNQWDEEWLAGHINSSGEQVSDGTYRLISKNFIPVIPNLQYCFTLTSMTDCGITIYGYDENEEFIGVVYDGNAHSNTRLFTPGVGVHYIKFQMYATYGQTASLTYNHDICINLSWSGYRNGEYEPFQKHSYALDDSLELRGIPKLSADNELYYDGDTYESDGRVTRRYGIVDLGTLTWRASTGSENKFYAQSSGQENKLPYAFGTDVKMICSRYVYTGMRAQVPFFGEDKTIQAYPRFRDANLSEIYVHDSAYNDASSFAAAMSGVMLVYELATPTTETAEPYVNPQIVDDFGTEEYVDYAFEQGLRGVKIPVGHVTEYQANLRDKLQHLPDPADSDGYYLIQQAGNQMTLARFRIPQAPTTDGTYTLKATVSGGTPTYVWVDDNATPEEDNT